MKGSNTRRAKISIVTVCKNSEATLETTLASVASQSHPYIEHIIVDGASTDGTLEIVERYRDAVATVVSEPDRGIYDGMNKGLRLATGDIIGTLNADDLYQDDRVLERVAERFEDPEIGASYADLVYVRKDNVDIAVRYWKSRPLRAGLIRRGWYPAHPTFFVRREVYGRCGLFDAAFPIAADVELMVRILGKHRVKAAYIPTVLVRMRVGGESNRSLKTIFWQNVAIYRALRKNRLACNPLFPLLKLPSRIGQFFRRPPRAG